MRKRALFLAMAIVMAAVFIGGGITFALFTDSTGPVDAGFMTATLEIDGQRNLGDPIPGPMFYTTASEGENHPTGPWAPGDEHHRVLQVENLGTISAWLKKVSATLDEKSGEDLTTVLDVKITTDGAGDEVVAAGKLSDFLGSGVDFKSPIPCEYYPDDPDGAWGDVVDLYFWVSLPLDTSNVYQDATCNVTFSVYAEQMANNP